ncbi:MAG: hypothetical protein K8S99_01630 [Planctomycetes bacterium]|nr:hypothetical protein [Planctomycetota bacterium]
MHVSIRVAFALTLALALLPLGACSQGVKVAGWQVLDPEPPIDVSTIVVTRTHAAAADAACCGQHDKCDMTDKCDHADKCDKTDKCDQTAVKQTLSIEPGSGHASLTDTDGRVYPLQIEKDRLEQLVEFVSHRTWMGEERHPPKREAAPMQYELTVVESGKPMKEKATWCVPSRKPLPEGFALLTDSFDKADRVAHPLSKSVDLLK